MGEQKKEEQVPQTEKKLEVKTIYTYLVSSMKNSISTEGHQIVNVARDVIKLQYPINSLENFQKFEKDFDLYKNRDNQNREIYTVLSFSLINSEHDIYYDNKPVRTKSSAEVAQDETKHK